MMNNGIASSCHICWNLQGCTSHKSRIEARQAWFHAGAGWWDQLYSHVQSTWWFLYKYIAVDFWGREQCCIGWWAGISHLCKRDRFEIVSLFVRTVFHMFGHRFPRDCFPYLLHKDRNVFCVERSGFTKKTSSRFSMTDSHRLAPKFLGKDNRCVVYSGLHMGSPGGRWNRQDHEISCSC